jgi:hypothetical protein
MHTKDNTVFVFDWDDTLMASSWLKSVGFRVPMLVNGGVTKEMVDACEQVAPHVARVILKAQEYGKVIILTNASKDWVEDGCARLMPSISTLILSIPIISAADLYSHCFWDPISWKKMAFRRDLLDMAFGREKIAPRNIISVGDGYAEQCAARLLMAQGEYSYFGPLTVKSLKIMAESTAVTLSLQLDEIHKNLDMLATHPGNLDIHWTTLPGQAVKVKEPEEEKKAEEPVAPLAPLAPYTRHEDNERDPWEQEILKAIFPALKGKGLVVITELPPIKRKVPRSSTPDGSSNKMSF